MTPWLTDAEVDDLCAGLVNDAAKVRHLRAQGLTVTRKPNGRPLVIRTHAEEVLSGRQPRPADASARTGAQPDKLGMLHLFPTRAGRAQKGAV